MFWKSSALAILGLAIASPVFAIAGSPTGSVANGANFSMTSGGTASPGAPGNIGTSIDGDGGVGNYCGNAYHSFKYGAKRLDGSYYWAMGYTGYNGAQTGYGEIADTATINLENDTEYVSFAKKCQRWSDSAESFSVDFGDPIAVGTPPPVTPPTYAIYDTSTASSTVEWGNGITNGVLETQSNPYGVDRVVCSVDALVQKNTSVTDNVRLTIYQANDWLAIPGRSFNVKAVASSTVDGYSLPTLGSEVPTTFAFNPCVKMFARQSYSYVFTRTSALPSAQDYVSSVTFNNVPEYQGAILNGSSWSDTTWNLGMIIRGSTSTGDFPDAVSKPTSTVPVIPDEPDYGIFTPLVNGLKWLFIPQFPDEELANLGETIRTRVPFGYITLTLDALTSGFPATSTPSTSAIVLNIPGTAMHNISFGSLHSFAISEPVTTFKKAILPYATVAFWLFILIGAWISAWWLVETI